jgi:hypothetical protein
MQARTLPLALGASALLLLVACGPSLASPTATVEATANTPEPPTPNPEPESALVPIDATWSEYSNHRLGFSIQVPNTMYHGMGDCIWREDGSDQSYRPVMAEVPVAVFEDIDRVYLTAASYIELTQPTQEPSGAGYRTFFAGCDRITNTLERVRDQESTSALWEIAVREVDGEADLEALIDDYYGECFSLGEVTETDTPGLFRVRVLGDGLTPEESTCRLFGMYVFLYSPGSQRAATWGTGQSVHFISNPETGEGHDAEMRESFRFLTE